MTLYHYCSNDTFLKIIGDRSIRLSMLTLSNDFTEGQWVSTILSRLCEKHGITTFQAAGVLEKLKQMLSLFSVVGFCMSKDGDSLSQWRGYANGGAGVSIGFNDQYLDSLIEKYYVEDKRRFKTENIVYDPERQMELLEKLVPPIKDFIAEGAGNVSSGGLFGLLNVESEEDKEKRIAADTGLWMHMLEFQIIAYRLKHPSFIDEKEVRIIESYTRLEDDESLAAKKRFKYFSRGDHLVPYVDLKMHETDTFPIDSIVVGPKNRTPKNVIEDFLFSVFGERAKQIEIYVSEAPYR